MTPTPLPYSPLVRFPRPDCLPTASSTPRSGTVVWAAAAHRVELLRLPFFLTYHQNSSLEQPRSAGCWRLREKIDLLTNYSLRAKPTRQACVTFWPYPCTPQYLYPFSLSLPLDRALRARCRPCPVLLFGMTILHLSCTNLTRRPGTSQAPSSSW